MVVSKERIESHIKEWKEKISNQKKKSWPKFIYHAADARVIKKILESGQLIPRNMQKTPMVHDVASPEALKNNPDALNYSRFYFRPRTLFHIRTEGIRCLDDKKRKGFDHEGQMSIPVMLCFDLLSISRMKEVFFTEKGYACLNTAKGNDDEFFNKIDFCSVYHDSETNEDKVRKKRMAEVVVAVPVLIKEHLKFIFCRTLYDKITLLTLLNEKELKNYHDIIKVAAVPESIFCHSLALFIRDLKFYNTSLLIKLKHPSDSSLNSYRVKIIQKNNSETLIEKDLTFEKSEAFYEVTGFFNQKECSWEIHIEEVLAFLGYIPSEKSEII